MREFVFAPGTREEDIVAMDGLVVRPGIRDQTENGPCLYLRMQRNK
jgi:hypothetical protein